MKTKGQMRINTIYKKRIYYI